MGWSGLRFVVLGVMHDDWTRALCSLGSLFLFCQTMFDQYASVQSVYNVAHCHQGFISFPGELHLIGHVYCTCCFKHWVNNSYYTALQIWLCFEVKLVMIKLFGDLEVEGLWKRYLHSLIAQGVSSSSFRAIPGPHGACDPAPAAWIKSTPVICLDSWVSIRK